MKNRNQKRWVFNKVNQVRGIIDLTTVQRNTKSSGININHKYKRYLRQTNCSILISIQINIILFNRRLRSDPDINVGRQSSFARLLLFKKSANGRNTRTSADQNDYYLRFLPSRNTRTSGDHNEYYLRFLPGSSPFTSY